MISRTPGTGVQIDDGTLVAAHANALGGNVQHRGHQQGKLGLRGLSLATGIQGSASGKSMVGDGTFSAITVSGTTDIKAISPGQGFLPL